MNSNKYFFICSCVLFAFSLLNYSLGPVINGKVDWVWSSQNCGKISDDLIEDQRKPQYSMTMETYKDYLFKISRCKNQVAMHCMEHISFIFNIAVSFICALLAIYIFQDKPIPKSNFIGMACGIIGFVLTLIYVILNGIVYTNYYDDKDLLKMKSDGSVLEYEENKGFKCYFYSDVGDKKAFIAKYSDYVKSQYNYDKALIDSYENEDKQRCSISTSSSSQYFYDLETCSKRGYLTFSGNYELIAEYCKKVYLKRDVLKKNYKNYNLGVRFLTVLLFSIFMLPCYCALVFFALKLSSNSSDYQPVKT